MRTLLALLWLSSIARADDPFARLKTLVGDWDAGRVHVSYRLVSNESVLVQRFVTASGKETLTVFHADGARLIATHYCAQGNQPRLRLESSAGDRFVFAFLDATNLASPSASHLARLELRLDGPSDYTEIETYQENGKPDATTLRFHRVDAQRAAWNRPTQPFRILDNIYYVGTEGLASYLIASPAGHVLLDGALEESVPQIEANIAQLGFRLRDVKLLVNSHAHFDHAGGLAKLKADSGAKLAASAGDRPLLEGGYYPGKPGAGFAKVVVDRVVADGERVTAGGVTLVAHLTPGHTPGCTTWSTVAHDGASERAVVFFCSATVAANRLAGAPTYPGIVEDYRRTFALAKKLPADVFLAPHPEMFHLAEKRARLGGGTPNPFVVPGELAAFVDELEKDFAVELAKQQAK